MSEEAVSHKPPKLVVYRSAITDIRTVEARLRRAGLEFDVEVMSMASQDERKRYRDLKQSSGHNTLPLIFADGDCLGGEPELARYLAARHRVEPASPQAPSPSGATARLETSPSTPMPATEQQAALAHSDATNSSAEVSPPEAPAADADSDRALRQRTAALGYGGVIPFLACAVASFVGPVSELARLALVAYAAVIFSFVGAVHWGFSLAQAPQPPRGLLVSVVPSLIAWVAVVLHVHFGIVVGGLTLLALGFILWHLFERSSARLPRHYLALRSRLTAVVAVTLLASALAHGLGFSVA